MPKVVAILPSSNGEEVKERLTKLMQAAADVQMALDPSGYAHAWMQDSARAVVAYEGDKATGFGMFHFGRRYYDGDMSASILFAQGPDRVAVLQHMKSMCEVLGVTKIFYEGDELGGEQAEMRVVRVN